MAEGQLEPAEPAPDGVDLRPGLLAACLVLCIYGGIALSVDFPRAALRHPERRGDLLHDGAQPRPGRRPRLPPRGPGRVWREFPCGPAGVFLKKGSGLDVRVTAPAVSARRVGRPDPDPRGSSTASRSSTRCSRRRSSRSFGTNGFLLFHASCWRLVTLGGVPVPERAVVAARSRCCSAVGVPHGVGGADVLRLDHAGAVQPRVCAPRRTSAGSTRRSPPDDASRGGCGWLLAPRPDAGGRAPARPGDVLEAVEPLLIVPLLALAAWRRQWRAAVVVGVVFGGRRWRCSRRNSAITGDWNFQGGDRRTFYGAFPFQTPDAAGTVGPDRATNRVLTEIIFDPEVFWTVLAHNLGVLRRRAATRASCRTSSRPSSRWRPFLLARRPAGAWQWLVLGAGARGDPAAARLDPLHLHRRRRRVGNRYFMNTYGVFLFLLPPIESVALAPWSRGSSARSSRRRSRSTRSSRRSTRPSTRSTARCAAAGRADAGQRPADQHAAARVRVPVRGAATVPDLLPRRQRVPARGETASGCRGARRPSSWSRPSSASRHCPAHAERRARREPVTVRSPADSGRSTLAPGEGTV